MGNEKTIGGMARHLSRKSLSIVYPGDVRLGEMHMLGEKHSDLIYALMKPSVDKVARTLSGTDKANVLAALMEMLVWVHVAGVLLGYDLEKHQEDYINAMYETLNLDSGHREYIKSVVVEMIKQDQLDAQDPGAN